MEEDGGSALGLLGVRHAWSGKARPFGLKKRPQSQILGGDGPLASARMIEGCSSPFPLDDAHDELLTAALAADNSWESEVLWPSSWRKWYGFTDLWLS